MSLVISVIVICAGAVLVFGDMLSRIQAGSFPSILYNVLIIFSPLIVSKIFIYLGMSITPLAILLSYFAFIVFVAVDTSVKNLRNKNRQYRCDDPFLLIFNTLMKTRRK